MNVTTTAGRVTLTALTLVMCQCGARQFEVKAPTVVRFRCKRRDCGLWNTVEVLD